MGTMLRAVVVGINEYKDERYRQDTRLHFASSDAQEIATLLEHSPTFTAESVVLLQGEKATRKAVRDSLNSTFSKRSFDSNTIALFYFAGHGIVNPHDKRISLCCHDVDFTDPESGGIRLNDVYEWLASSSAECVIAIIDACFSGGMISGHVDHISAAQHAMQAIEALRYPEGKTVAIFAACGSNEQARERSGLHHGIFTHELLRGWRDGAAREKDGGIVYLLGLANFLTQDPTKYKQKPQVTIRGALPVALWKMVPSAVSVTPPLEPAPAQLSWVATPPPSQSGMVYSQFTLPTERRTESATIKDRNKLFIFFACLLVLALTLCGSSIFFIVHLISHH